MKQFNHLRVWTECGDYDFAVWQTFIDAAPNESLVPYLDWIRFEYYSE